MPTTQLETLPDLTGAEKRSLLSKFVTILEDEGGDSCLVECPGAELHTSANAPTDCFASFRDGEVPTISCYHSSCSDEIAAANLQWRSACGKEKVRQSGWSPRDNSGPRGKLLINGREVWSGPVTSPQVTGCPSIDSDPGHLARQRLVAASRAHRERVAAAESKAAAMLPQILEDYAWPVARIIERSPGKIPNEIDVALEWRRFLSLWRHDDGIWCGEVEDSGNEKKHAYHFKSAEEWARYDGPPTDCHFTSAVSFLPGSYARSQENVKRVPFLVVEGDKLHDDPKENEARCGAVIRWLSRRLELLMIVRTGGRSLHAWFRHPGLDHLTKLTPILDGLGMDSRLSTVSQPCRLPGRPRPGKNAFQQIIWFHQDHLWPEQPATLTKTH